MSLRITLLVPAALLLAACSHDSRGDTPPATAPAAEATAAQSVTRCGDTSGWDDPATPLRVHGDTWYVGTCGIAALLVTSPDGHVLIDGATPKGGPQIIDNIRTLGFDPNDVRAIVFSHDISTTSAACGAGATVRRVRSSPAMARSGAVPATKRPPFGDWTRSTPCGVPLADDGSCTRAA